MFAIGLATYSVRLVDKTTHKSLKFGEILPAKDFLKFIESFLEILQKTSSDDIATAKLMRVTPGTIKKNNREFSGIIETGEYGYESPIVNKDTGKTDFVRKKEHASMLPFYFFMSLPKSEEVGLLILQRFGNYGISKIFRKSLQKYINNELPHIRVEFNHIFSDRLLQKLIKEGEIKKITFTRFDIPKDYADYFEKGARNEHTGRLEYSLVANKSYGLRLGERLNKLLFGNGNVRKLVELRNFAYDETKIEIKMGKKTRRFSLGSFMKFRAYYDITDDVKIGAAGFPDPIGVHKKALEVKEEIDIILYPELNE